MTSSFRKGQLVAVRDHPAAGWTLRTYDHASPEGRHFCLCPDKTGAPCWWELATPAEEVWPNLFLACDHKDVVYWKRQVDKRDAQIQWLCDMLAGRTHGTLDCPPNIETRDACYAGMASCANCWARASREAVEAEHG